MINKWHKITGKNVRKIYDKPHQLQFLTEKESETVTGSFLKFKTKRTDDSEFKISSSVQITEENCFYISKN